MEEYEKHWRFYRKEGSRRVVGRKMLGGTQLSIIETTEHADFLNIDVQY